MEINVYGCGEIAQAIFLGPKNPASSWHIHTYTPSYTRAEALAQACRGRAYRKIVEMPRSPYSLLALKPQQFPRLARELSPRLSPTTTVISVMAGVAVRYLQEQLAVRKVIRVMPNTPCQVGRGISLITCSREVTAQEFNEVQALLEGISTVIVCSSEDELDRMMAVSACGPAYLFELARILGEYLQSRGCPAETANQVVKELFAGSSRLMEQSADSFTTLRRKVTSEGGATQQALAHLKAENLPALFYQAMNIAYQRAKKLTLI